LFDDDFFESTFLIVDNFSSRLNAELEEILEDDDEDKESFMELFALTN